MKVAIAYDCLYPFTIGGAEKWYRSLAEQLARRHQVSFLTRRQWSTPEPPRLGARLEVIDVSGANSLYGEHGRRQIGPTLEYGLGLFTHLLRTRGRYDVVHVASFPFFSVLAARAAHALGGPPCVVDWLEVWSKEGWRTYLGPWRGKLGAMIQKLCVRVSNRAVVHSELHAARLEDAGCPVRPVLLSGLYDGPQPDVGESTRAPLVVFAGRHIPEKGVMAIPGAIAAARGRVPGLEAIVFGDGPERASVEREIHRLGLREVVRCPGFASEDELRSALRRAMCLVLPSSREGYGLIVVEAAAQGTPSIVLRAGESAATELISPGENGLIVDSATSEALADAFVSVHERQSALVASTAAWFRRNAARLEIDASIEDLERIYRSAAGG